LKEVLRKERNEDVIEAIEEAIEFINEGLENAKDDDE